MTRTSPPGAYVGPSGAGPYVGVALIPPEEGMKAYILHFSATSDVTAGFIEVGFGTVLGGQILAPRGYEAVICGNAEPAGNINTDPNWQENNSTRLHALEEVVAFLRNGNVSITAYLPTSGFAIDESGWVYWTQPPGAPGDYER